MAEARGRDNWAYTSAVLALVANVNLDPKKTRAYRPADFDPYAQHDRRRVVADKDSLAILREALEGRKGNEHGR